MMPDFSQPGRWFVNLFKVDNVKPPAQEQAQTELEADAETDEEYEMQQEMGQMDIDA